MPRVANKLTALQIKKLSKPGRYADGNGLYLQVTLSGKSWLFRYMRNGRSREMGLGPLQLVPLTEARQKALDQRKLLLEGTDPIDARRANKPARRAPTFSEAAKTYIEVHEPAWKNAKHAAQWRSTLKSYAEPVLGHVPVDQINTDLVLRVLTPIWTTKTETASRVRGRIESILSWAKVQGHRSGENPAQWRGHLDQTLPKRSQMQRTKHHSALPYNKLPSFFAQLNATDGIAARALEFTILTATRTNEVMHASWSEFDLDAKSPLWVIPASRMKAGTEHRVPIPSPAVHLLQGLPRSDAYVFEARQNRPIPSDAMRRILRDLKYSDITVHGFRSTFRDWAAEQTAFTVEVCEMALAHTISNAAEAAYRRGDLLGKRRKLMEQWANFCTQPSGESQVTRIRREATA